MAVVFLYYYFFILQMHLCLNISILLDNVYIKNDHSEMLGFALNILSIEEKKQAEN